VRVIDKHRPLKHYQFPLNMQLMETEMDRRSALAGMAGMAAGLSLSGAGRAITGRRRRWGVQLFTVLEPLERDFPGTLREIAAMGYREVETIGCFGRDPAYVRDLLDRFGLVSPSQHIASNDIYAHFAAWARRELTREQIGAIYVEAFQIDKAMALVEGAIRQAKILGQRYVVWPILFEAQLADRDTISRYTQLFNRAGELCRAADLIFCFHNHDREFRKIGNDVIYDIILAETDPAFVAMEMDFYWVSKANVDPASYLKRYANRFRMVHVKDMAADGGFAVVGSGTLPIVKLIAMARDLGIEHFFVEYDRSDNPMDDVRRSIGFLNARAG
jgi:sugar phosphate isomerase/epimerase